MVGRTLSVIIPTYQRPDWIKRAVHSLARQTRVPDEVIPVARNADTATHDSIDELAREGLPFPIRRGTVSEPGFMPPVHEGFRLAQGTIVAVLDDDAEALEDWAARLLAHYDVAGVGAVGGRCINVRGDDSAEDVGTTDRVGYLSPLGKIVGDMYKNPTFDRAVDVSFMMGGCMSYRRSVAQRLEFDWELNRVVATHYEVDLGLQVRKMGYRILFDPHVAIRHYTAPRAIVGNRKRGDAESVRWNCYNETRVVLRRLPPWRAAVFLARGLAIGFRGSPGVLPWMFAPIARRAGFVTAVAAAATRGRLESLRAVARGASRSVDD